MRILVTGGAGFIGSAVIREIIDNTVDTVVNVDCLTYAGNLLNVAGAAGSERYTFSQTDICDRDALREVIDNFRPDIVMHLAAESHVDRSIDDPGAFITTNVLGTYNLLTCCLDFYVRLSANDRGRFRFHHVSTDEVFGNLGADGLFNEDTPYQPNSPYSASKASADHLVRAWFRTYGLPTVVTNCSNNYGPYQFPEKLIPLMILNAVEGKPLPVYGNGEQVRDWLYVEDHARALVTVAKAGRPGETYNIGGHNQVKNIDVVRQLCGLLDQKVNNKPGGIYRFADLITFVDDRPGHDIRYAIDATKVRRELGWVPKESFATGLEKTVDWYLAHLDWCEQVQEGNYQRTRLGVIR